MIFKNSTLAIALAASAYLLPNVAFAVDKCGNFTSKDNPLQCCKEPDTKKGQEGNCTWWAWKMATDNWGKSPSKRAPSNWISDAKANSFFKVSTTPVANSVAASSGHVAWVTSVPAQECIQKDKKGKCTKYEQYVMVSEMNCAKTVDAYRPSAKYKASYFSGYITKK